MAGYTLCFVLVLLALACEANSTSASTLQGDKSRSVTKEEAKNAASSGWEDADQVNAARGASNRNILLDLMKNDKRKPVEGVVGGEDEFSGTENSLYTGSSEENNSQNRTAVDGSEGDTVISGENSEENNNVSQDNNRSILNHEDTLDLQETSLSAAPEFMKDKEKEHHKSMKTQAEIQDKEPLELGQQSYEADLDNNNELGNPSMKKNDSSIIQKSEARKELEFGSGNEIVPGTMSSSHEQRETQGTDMSFNKPKLLQHEGDEQEAAGEPEFSGRDPLSANGAKLLNHEPSKHKTAGGQESGSGHDLMESGRQGPKQSEPTQITAAAEESGSDGMSADFEATGSAPSLLKAVRLKHQQNHTKQLIKGKGENEEGKTAPVDPILLLQMRKIRTNVLKANEQATKELNDVRKEFRARIDDLQQDLALVKRLTSKVHRKIGITVRNALEMARQAKMKASNRLYQTKRAATALNNIEKELGVDHTFNASRILRSRIPQFPKMKKVALYQQLLQTEKILTKLDGAKTLAVDRAEKRFRSEQKTGSSIEMEVYSLKHELASAEDELSAETEAEMEDEQEAQEKLQEAVERNRDIAKKTALGLTAIERYLEKLETDETQLKRLKF